MRALSATQRRGLRPAFGGFEAYAVRDVGNRIAIRINPKFINCFRRKRNRGCGAWRVHSGGRMNIHNQDRLASIPRLGEGKQVSEIEASVSVWKAKIRTRVMV